MNMKKVLRIFGKAVLVLLILAVAALIVIFVYNRIMLGREKDIFKNPLGEMVEVDGHEMCVYSKGEGKHTLVFLSGSGTVSPILDFKGLYSLFEDDYRIVVIEKFGYGFSDIVDDDRSFDTILRQDRDALSKLGINGPYVLCPHSMSGLEAILWAQKYPDEVEAIVGLDMSVPKAYESYDVKGTERLEKLAAFGRELGIVRLFYTDSSLPDSLSDDEKAIYRAIGAKIAVNDDVINEGLSIPDVIREIDSAEKPDVPMLLFATDGKETGLDGWTQAQKDYIKDLTDANIIELDCGHYVHNYEQSKISEYMKDFIESLADR